MAGCVYLGIDPGASGGLAVVGRPVVCNSMPKTEKDIWSWIEGIRLAHPVIKAMIEKVGGYMPGSGGNIGSAMFKFGAGYGGLRMALIGLGIPFEEVSPRTWQKALGVTPRKKTETRTQFKNRLKQKAQQLFPNQNVTLATADALLVAEFCRRKNEGKL